MPSLEETVLRTESGINLNQKGDKKYRFNPPSGTLILTDTRLIFAQSGGEFAKRLIVGGLLGGIVGSEAMRVATKVSKEHLDEALQRPDSFAVDLHDITDMRVKKEWGASLFIIECNAPGMSQAHLFRQGSLSSFKGFDEWIGDIKSAKEKAAIPAQQAPPPQPAYQPPPPTQYVAPPAPQPAQGVPGARFCPNCGQAVTPQDKFCPNCGASQQKQPPVCPKCGNVANPGQKFCNNCGVQL